MLATRRSAFAWRAAVIVLAALAAGCANAPGAPHSPAAAAAAAPDSALLAAVARADRPEAERARDRDRRPAESLAFWGVRPGDAIIEISPGGGYWTEILAPYARATGGRFVAAHFNVSRPEAPQWQRDALAAYRARFADPAVYGAIEVTEFGPASGPLGPPASADFVLSARSVHGWLGAGIVDKAFADFFAVLKPGGVLAIEQHRAPDTQTDLEWMAANGYVSEALVIAAAEKAGFTLAARSELNANPKDDRDHPFGVWTLPPVRRGPETPDPSFDRAAYDAIGESDRMTLRFVKPKA